ncbi:MAG: hypothetical protein CME62_01235 [Halobacteriovoraceae bacterium]|nr:hypothetical protein [Halobacteriovoraceae bacterium]|tara:strand:- start:97 stop:5199 length:5103 start_codon:yes stop_codon:yes gene_type:complete
MSSKILLNMFGELPDDFLSYLEQASIKLVTRDEVSAESEIDFILVDSVEAAQERGEEFKCNQRGIKIICLGKRSEIKSFLLSGGRFFINSDFAKSELGKFALTKFIEEKANIHLEESFSASFEDFKKFNIINHLATGHSLDRLSTEAFEQGFNPVNIRSYVDHTIFYLTYLKQSGKAGVPFEFEYAHNETHFVLNMFASVEGFSAEFIMDSFGEVNEDRPLQFLMGIAANSCDFLDITYVEDPGKIVLTAFFGKGEDQRFKGLAFNNIQTTAQIMAQLERKLSNFSPEEAIVTELAEKQNGLIDQELPGGFFDIPKPPEDSILNNEEKREEIMNKVEGKFSELFPDKDISQMTPEDFGQIINSFPEDEQVALKENLSQDDQDYLIESMQKKTIIDEANSIKEEARQEISQNPEKLEQIRKQAADDIVEKVADQMSVDKVNEILASEGADQSNEPELAFNIAVDPESFVPPKFKEGEDPFFTAPGEFADPIKAAEQAVQFAEDNFNNPQEAQAFAIQMAEKAHEHFDDPEKAKQFTEILGEKIGADLSPKQQEAFQEVLDSKAIGDEGPSINIFASANLIPKESSADGPTIPEFKDPKEAAQNLAEQTNKHYDEAPDIQAFALSQIAQAKDKFPDEESKKEFIEGIKDQFSEQISDPASQKVFEKAIEFQLSDSFSPDTSFMQDVGDPFAVAPGEFADPVEAAKKVAAIAQEKFDDPEEAQAFALNMAFQAHGKFPNPEDFAAALSSEFEDSFDNDQQQTDFTGTLNALASGMGGKSPELEEDPFGSGFVATPESAEKVKGSLPEPEEDQVVKGGAVEEEGVISVGGEEAGDEHASRVKGGKEAADNFAQKIRGTTPDKKGEFSVRFSDSFGEGNEKGAFNFRTLKPKDRKKELNKFVKSTLDNDDVLSGLDETIKAFVHREAPEKINKALEDFAFSQGIDINQLSDEAMDEFRKTRLPQVMSDVLEDEKQIISFQSTLESVDKKEPFKVISSKKSNPDEGQFNLRLKEQLEEKLMGLDGVTQEDGHLVISSELAQDSNFQALIKDSMSTALQGDMDLHDLSPESINKSQANVTKSLAKSFQLEDDKVQSLVKDSSEKAIEQVEKQVVKEQQSQKPADNQQGQNQQASNQDSKGQSQKTEAQSQASSPTSPKEAASQGNKQEQVALMKKVKEAEAQKKQAELKLKAMEVKLKAAEAATEKMNKVNSESEVDNDSAQDAGEKAFAEKQKNGEIPTEALSSNEREKLMGDLKAGRQLNPEEMEKLAKAMENEQKVREMAKKAEVEIKKLQMETQKKEQIFRGEFSKTEKALKAKDSVIEKAKEDMKILLGKKEKELDNTRQQVNELQQRLASDKSAQMKQELKIAKKQAEESAKMTEVYRSKVEALSKAANDSERDSNIALVEEENRNLKRLKTQLENKLNTDTRQLRSLEERYNHSKQGEMEAKNALAQHKASLKQAQGQLKLLATQNERLKKMSAQASASKSPSDDRELNMAKAHNAKLQENIRRLNAKLEQAAKAGLDQASKVEGAVVQKVKKELEEKNREVDLVKKQMAKLQEKIQSLEKQNDEMVVQDVAPEKVAEVKKQKDDKESAAFEKEVELLKSQNEELQDKLKKAVDKIKEAEASADSPEPSKKEERLERSIKSMNTELSKAKNDAAEMKKKAMTMKTKVTGLENEVTKLKKENEKLKQTAAQLAKKNGKKAA